MLLFIAVSLHVWGVRSPEPQEPVYARLASRLVAAVLVSPPIPLAPPLRVFTSRPSSNAQQRVTLRTSLLNFPAMPGPPTASAAILADQPLPVGTSGRAIGGAPDTLDAGLVPVTTSLPSVLLDPAPPAAPPGEHRPAPMNVAALAIPLRETRLQGAAPFSDRLALSATRALPADRKEAAPRDAAEDQRRQKEVVLAVVHEYARALERLDVLATKAVYPSIDDRRLQRAFQGLEEQQFHFASCGVSLSLSGDDANAWCKGNATYRPKVGSRGVKRLTDQEWVFSLARDGGGWQILEARIQ